MQSHGMGSTRFTISFFVFISGIRVIRGRSRLFWLRLGEARLRKDLDRSGISESTY
jgi:hypothetical protein